MGWTSENVAEHYNISREKQDQFAFISHTRASEALKKGVFADEILPVEVRGRTVSVDDTIRPGVTAEGLASLKPAFPQWQPGTTTAGNASGVGDGAGLIMMTTRERAEKEGMDILGKWIGGTVVGKLVSYVLPLEQVEYASPQVLNHDIWAFRLFSQFPRCWSKSV
jgi:acetyl-CoA acyltransferase 1